MTQAWTLRDRNKKKDFYAYWSDSDEGDGFSSVDEPVLLDKTDAEQQLSWFPGCRDRYQKNLELEIVEIQYTVIEK